jgi:molybdopterin-guanine dinucleotide biosynthesis protein A
VHGLILAGGEGSRLAADGIRDPKPLVTVGGRPQLLRLCETLEALGCQDVTCLVRRGVPTEAVVHPGTRRVAIPCETPSSLHTLALGFEAVPHGPVLCTMVDTVMPWESWVTVRDAWPAVREVDGVLLAVAPAPARDPSPLRVEVDAAGWVTAIGAEAGDARVATAGVYVFGPAARARAPEAVARGVERMRGFLASLPGSGVRLRAVEIPRAVDLDRREDLEEANTWAPTVTP